MKMMVRYSANKITRCVMACAAGAMVTYLIWMTSVAGLFYNQSRSYPTNSKVILMWTSVYDTPASVWAESMSNFVKFCPHLQNRCYLSGDRSDWQRADAVLFQLWPSVWKGAIDSPPIRQQRQYYIAHTYEAPGRNLFDNTNFWDRFPPAFFNSTMTYRPDSDYPMPYLAFKNKVDKKIKFQMPSIEPRHRKMAVWFVSHCKTESKREYYVRELAKYIQIDIFGGCGNRTDCPRFNGKCTFAVAGRYNFYLAFENNVCQHYHTEKLRIPLKMYVPTIPIVLAANTVAQVAPPRSYIDVGDFSSPQKLAMFLKDLVNHKEKYNSYFSWRKNYQLLSESYLAKNAMCSLCSDLVNSGSVTRVITNMKQWFTDGQCNNDGNYLKYP